MSMRYLSKSKYTAFRQCPKIKGMSPDEKQAARQELLEYCHLDTLAMVRIWQKLEEISVWESKNLTLNSTELARAKMK